MASNKIIIDAAHEEEIRMAILCDDQLEEYQFEVENKEEVKGNIYLAKVTRVEGSLQAAFVEYGRNRQAFLPFNEISIEDFCIPEEKKQELINRYIADQKLRKQNRQSRTRPHAQSFKGKTVIDITSKLSDTADSAETAGTAIVDTSRGNMADLNQASVLTAEVKAKVHNNTQESSTASVPMADTLETATIRKPEEKQSTIIVDATSSAGSTTSIGSQAKNILEQELDVQAKASHLDANMEALLQDVDSGYVTDLTKLSSKSYTPSAPKAAEASREVNNKRSNEEVLDTACSSNSSPVSTEKDQHIADTNTADNSAKIDNEDASAPQPGKGRRNVDNRNRRNNTAPASSETTPISEEPTVPEVDTAGSTSDTLEEEYLAHGTRFGYKIDDVIRKNQLLLVQVVKDERGSKGAYVTTHLSIPGRYCVYMPKSYTNEGGISKKISDNAARSRLKSILKKLDLKGNLIIRTAGVDKSEEEIKQDYSYITSLWNSIKEFYATNSTPALIYEEASLIKKTLRDVPFDEVHVNNKNTYLNIIDFVKLISPDLVSRVKLFQAKGNTIFSYFNIEEQIKNIYSPLVALKSGGYLVIHPTEALTAIDINSGKFKSNKNVEETALRNNIEAAKEIARQLRLRNIGGLVVIDFIDMENPKNRTFVEKKLKEELRSDRAKIQIGEISKFGLLEMARQHVSSSLFDKNFVICPKCQGLGYLRPLGLNSLQILRDIKEHISNIENIDGKSFNIAMPTREAFYILNLKRHELNTLEEFFNIRLTLECDDELSYPFYNLQEAKHISDAPKPKTVLLLETEMANKVNSHKVQDEQPAPSSKPASNNNRRGRGNKRQTYGRGSNNHHNKNHKRESNTSHNRQPTGEKKGGWFKKLLGIKK